MSDDPGLLPQMVRDLNVGLQRPGLLSNVTNSKTLSGNGYSAKPVFAVMGVNRWR